MQREPGPVNDTVEDWAGQGSWHRRTQVMGGRESCFVIGAARVATAVHNPPDGTCSVSFSERGWGSSALRRMDLAVWTAAVRGHLQAGEPLAAVDVVLRRSNVGVAVAVVGECDRIGPCCARGGAVEEPQLQEAAVSGSAVRLLGADVSCGACGERRTLEVYASALSALEGGSGRFEDLEAGSGEVVRTSWPAAVLPEPSLFAAHALAAIGAERAFDAERAAAALEMLRSGGVNFAGNFDADSVDMMGRSRRSGIVQAFYSIASMCAHHGVSAVLGTADDLERARQAGKVGYRGEVVVRVDPEMSLRHQDGKVAASVSLGCFVSYGSGCQYQETDTGTIELSWDMSSRWTTGPTMVQDPRRALGLDPEPELESAMEGLGL